MAPAGDARARATVTVTIDNERDIAALNAWLRRICGFPLHKALPSEATFLRAFDESAGGSLAGC